jgi:signal transduction histidine kinase
MVTTSLMPTVILLATVLNLFLGLFVYRSNPSSWLHRWYGVFGLVTAFWVLVNFMTGIFPTLFWIKSAYAFGALVPASAVMWILVLCKKKLSKLKIFSIWILASIFFVVSYLDELILADVTKVYLGGYEGRYGSVFPLYAMYMLGILFFIIHKLLLGYWKAKGIQKLQLKYVLIGSALLSLFVATVSFVLPLCGILQYTALDSPSTFVFLLFTAYAISKHHLMNIRVISTELLVGLVGFILLIDLALSKSLLILSLKSGIFVVFVYLGWSLVQSVFKEIKRGKKLEKMTKQLKLANLELRQLDQAKTEFLSIASHQLRTPLTAIRGYLSMIGEGDYGSVPREAKKAIAKIYQATTRLIGLTNSFLNVTRIKAGKISFTPSLVDFPDLVSSVIQELKPDAEQKNLFLEYKKTKEKIPKVKIDQEKIRQVILNVLDNAIKYTTKGGITITLKVIETEQKLQLKIKDTGEGISASEMDKLFRSFSRGAAGSHLYSAGAGLGLYVARRFVDIHPGGKIWAESPGRGKGSTFYLELPIEETKGKHNF